MPKTAAWLCSAGLILAIVVGLSGCGVAPVAQSQSGTVADPRPNQQSALDQALLADVDAAITAAKQRGNDVDIAQKLRDSAVDLASKGLYEEANGNLKIAAGQVGVLVGAGGEPVPAVADAYKPAQAAPPPVTRANEPKLLDTSFASLKSLDGWERIGVPTAFGTPLWELRDGMVLQRGVDGTDSSSEHTGLVSGDAAWRDVTVTASALSHHARELGVIVRYSDGKYYRFRAMAGGDETAGTFILEKVIDGAATQLATFDGTPLTLDTWHTLSLSAEGSTLRAAVDGREVGQAEDNTLGAGRAGIVTRAEDGAYFANVVVTGR